MKSYLSSSEGVSKSSDSELNTRREIKSPISQHFNALSRPSCDVQLIVNELKLNDSQMKCAVHHCIWNARSDAYAQPAKDAQPDDKSFAILPNETHHLILMEPFG